MIVPTSLTLATVTVNDWVTTLVPSVAERTTELSPTSESPGVPDSVPVETDSQLGHVVQDRVMASASGSLKVGV